MQTAADSPALGPHVRFALFFREFSGLPTPPFDLRVTDVFDRVVVVRGAVRQVGVLGEFPTKAQFPALTAEQVAEWRAQTAVSRVHGQAFVAALSVWEDGCAYVGVARMGPGPCGSCAGFGAKRA